MTSTFYVTGGTLRHDAPSYVERQADKALLEGLLNGEFCYVLTSRQMGKSSLMVRTANKLKEQGIAVVVLDLTAIGQNITPDQWYDGLLVRMGRQLEIEDKLDSYWQTHPKMGPCQRFFEAIRDVLLKTSGPLLQSDSRSRPEKIVIFVDEIDTVRSLPFSTDEFFAGIRASYNRRTEDTEFERVTFCLLGVAMPSDLISNSRLTPFNIGRRIELNDFTLEEAAVLARGLESATIHQPLAKSSLPNEITPHPGPLPIRGEGEASPLAKIRAQQLLERVLYWTNGHPYLTQRLCGAVLESKSNGVEDPRRFMDELCAELFFSARARERDDNLIFVREHLLRSEADRASLFHLYEKVLRGGRIPDDETNPLIGALRLTGVVRVTPGGLVGRNRIYSRVFDQRWVRANMPDAEVLRQRAAFRHGVLRATAIAALIIAAMIVMVLIATNEAAKARRALALSYVSQARAGRLSGLSGQRYDSLDALREARRFHANELVLRDEVIACLALADLREKTNAAFESLKHIDVSDLSSDLEVSATAERDRSIVLRQVDNGKRLGSLPGFGLPVRRLRFAPKEPFLLAEYHGAGGGEARDQQASSGEQEDQIVVWNWQSGQNLFKVPCAVRAGAVDFSLDGRKLAVGQDDGRVFVYALPRGEILRELDLRWDSGLPRAPHALRFHPSGRLLAESCLDDPNVQVWDLNTGQIAFRFYHPGKVFDLSWHPQGELLASACADSCIYLWDTNHTDTPLKKLIGHENGVKAVAFNHRGTVLASAGVDETLRLWVPATDRQVARRLDGEIFDRLQFSSNDTVLIANLEGLRRTRAWDVSGDEHIALLVRTGSAEKLKSIDFSPDGKWLTAATGDRIFVWDSSSGRESANLGVGRAHAVSFAKDSRHLFAITDSGLFQYPLKKAIRGDEPRLEPGTTQRFHQVPDELDAMALSLDRTEAVVAHRKEVQIVSLSEGTNSIGRAIHLGNHYRWLALHPNGTWMAALAMGSNSIHIWNLSAASNSLSKPQHTIPGSEYLVFSPDGKWFVTCWTGRFHFYRVALDPEGPLLSQTSTFSIARTPASNQHAPIAFARNGGLVALASSRYTIHLLKLNADERTPPKVIASLESPDRSPLEMLAFSPDGRCLAAATANLTVQIWNLALLREGLAELELDHDWQQLVPGIEKLTTKLNPNDYDFNAPKQHAK
jgi:WD40 repeat protein